MDDRVQYIPRPSDTDTREARIRAFMKHLGAYERGIQRGTTLDAMLDVYGEWKRHGTWERQLRVLALASEYVQLGGQPLDITFRGA